MSSLRLFCSMVVVVLSLSVVVAQRTEQIAPQATTAVSPDGHTIAIARSTGGFKKRIGRVELWDLNSGALQRVITGFDGPIWSKSFSKNGRSLLTISTGHLTESLETEQEITAIAIDTSGQVLAAATADRSIAVWNVATGALKSELKKHRDVVTALAFSPDGRMLASGGDDRNLILWELASGKVTRTFANPEQTITSIAFSPNGQLLASGAGNESVSLWNVRNGKLER